MNTNMYDNPVTQDNLEILRGYGMEVIEPDTGRLACNTVGKGKMPSEEVLLAHILQEIQYEKDLAGKKVLITAGATREAIDPVRYITNHSTGKMGYALATVAARRGAKVTLVSGVTNLEVPLFVDYVPVESAEDMFETVTKAAPEQDIIIKSAAVADYTPVSTATEKIKKKKKADMIVANNLKVEGAGFGTDTNVVTLITDKEAKELPKMTKEEVSVEIFNEIVKISSHC